MLFALSIPSIYAPCFRSKRCALQAELAALESNGTAVLSPVQRPSNGKQKNSSKPLVTAHKLNAKPKAKQHTAVRPKANHATGVKPKSGRKPKVRAPRPLPLPSTPLLFSESIKILNPKRGKHTSRKQRKPHPHRKPHHRQKHHSHHVHHVRHHAPPQDRSHQLTEVGK